jgi:uncharacterized protein YeaO (DUF488 family)
MIYLSSFAMAGKDGRAVSIAAITPRGFKGAVRKDLAPPFSLVKAFKDEKITMEQYIGEYCNRIYQLDLERIAADLDGKIALCYCGKEQLCHRTLLGLVLHAELDAEVEEIGGFADAEAQSYELKENPMCHRPTPDYLKKYGIEDLALTEKEAAAAGFADLSTPVIYNKWREMKKRGLLGCYRADA